MQTWLNFALQQMAAESYLDQVPIWRIACQVLPTETTTKTSFSWSIYWRDTLVDLAGVSNATQIVGSAQALCPVTKSLIITRAMPQDFRPP